ncbi:MAG: hypothetical protein FWC03_09835 [Treponema sp.]|nr:hypothetical protein [Treponema sp.]
MKKTQMLFVAAIIAISIIAIGCAGQPAASSSTAAPAAAAAAPAGPANDPNYNYRITGNFAGWGNSYEAEWMMENVSKDDPRIAPIRDALADAMYVYLKEYTPDVSNPAGWDVTYSGANISLDGNFAVKFIRLVADASEESGWFHDMWVPSTEAGGIKNLSPDTVFTPMARSDEEAEAAGDGLGSNNGNPVLIGGVNTYYVVFAVMNDRSRAMGAVVK